jgi:hypothetical protein
MQGMNGDFARSPLSESNPSEKMTHLRHFFGRKTSVFMTHLRHENANKNANLAIKNPLQNTKTGDKFFPSVISRPALG